MTDGILNIDKPAGWTSFDVVAFVRRRAGIRRVGHGGTLDPAATGVLPLLLGRATRLSEYLAEAGKTYVADVLLGVETNTYDSEGEVVARRDASAMTAAQVEAALAAFRGEFDQLPPAFSAIKRAGVPLYKLARRGDSVELAPRRVSTQRLEIVSFEPPLLRLEIDCSKGFYVRSLAHDLGESLGVGGSLAALRRTRVGSFGLETAIDPDALATEIEADAWQERLWAPDEVLLGWQAAVLGEDSRVRLAQGRPIARSGEPRASGLCRAYSTGGDFLAVLRAEGSHWRPEKVFALS